MVIFVTIITLFVIGSLSGWVIEVFFRRFFSQKKWMNPGFLVGPYLPIYGFGTILLYGLSNIDLSFIGLAENNPWLYVIKVLIIGVGLITVEFIAGLIFIKGMGIKLWDYSKRPGNIMGIVCPLFDVLWLLAGSVYFFFINPYLVKAITWLAKEPNHIYYFFIGIVIGMMITDFAYSMHIATRIRKFAKNNKVIIDLEKFKENLKEKTYALKLKQAENNSKLKEKLKKPFFFLLKNKDDEIKESVDEYIKKEDKVNK